MGQTDKRTPEWPDHDEFNDARWWLTPEEEEAAQIRSWKLGKALAGTLKPRPKVIDLNDADLEPSSWVAAGIIRPRPPPPDPPKVAQKSERDEELDSWKIGQGLAGTVKPRPKL